MEFTEYLPILRAHWRALAAFTLLGALAAVGYTLQQPKIYAANATGVVSAGASSDAGMQNLGDSLAKSKVKSYVQLATDRATAQIVIDDLGLDASASGLAGQISVDQPLDTSYLTITARSTSPQEAQELADAWVDALAQRVADIETPDGDDPEQGLHVIKSASAVLPTSPVSPRPRLNLALGLLAGAAVGIAYALLRHRLDRRIRTSEAVEKEFGISVVGAIPDSPDLHHDYGALTPIVVTESASMASPTAEAFRKLRSNLAFMDVDNPPRVIVVTSPHQGDGKSTIAANLAAAIALSGEHVTLIDGDLRRPTVAKSFGLAEGVGLTDVLIGRMSAAEVRQPHAGIPGLHVIAAGSRPPNPSELLGSKAMRHLLEELSAESIVLIDAPPLLPVTDAAVLARSADGALISISTGKTLDTELGAAISSVKAVQAKVLGIVLNRVSKRNAGSSYGGGYQYQYNYQYTYGAGDKAAPETPAPAASNGTSPAPGGKRRKDSGRRSRA